MTEAFAMMSTQAGGPETLEKTAIAIAQPGQGEVLIRVKAAGVNFPDTIIIRDLYQFKPELPFAPGGEVGGVIEAVGDGVEGYAIGDQVLGLPMVTGGFATHIVLPVGRIAKMPDGMRFEEAASFIFTYGTSYYGLADCGRLARGETLLVLGAAGGIGASAVELGKAMGATVIGAVSSDEKAEFVRSLGADECLIYPKDMDRDAQKAFGKAIKTAAPQGIDVVYDPVGGAYAEPALRTLNWNGRFLVVGFPAGIPKIPLNLPLLKNCHISGVFWGAHVERDPKRHQEEVEELLALYRQGKVKPRVSETLPLENAREALEKIENREAKGKIVLVVG